MASPVTRSETNRTPLGCSRMGDLQHNRAADKEAGVLGTIKQGNNNSAQ